MAQRFSGEYAAQRFKPGTVFKYWAAVLPATLPGGSNRAMRMNDYDIFSSEYPNFLVEELIPALCMRHGFQISPAADMHCISGGSSGGISAWNAARCRNDFFHRVYMSSPSFLEMGRGRELIALMRKVETKPIRVYMEYSENEPIEYFGSSFCAAQEAKMALEYAGYDVKCVYFPGEGHCSRYHQNNGETLRAGFAFLWQGWRDTPVQAKHVSCRAEKLVLVGSTLYVRAGENVFARQMQLNQADKDTMTVPAPASYYD